MPVTVTAVAGVPHWCSSSKRRLPLYSILLTPFRSFYLPAYLLQTYIQRECFRSENEVWTAWLFTWRPTSSAVHIRSTELLTVCRLLKTFFTPRPWINWLPWTMAGASRPVYMSYFRKNSRVRSLKQPAPGTTPLNSVSKDRSWQRP